MWATWISFLIRRWQHLVQRKLVIYRPTIQKRIYKGKTIMATQNWSDEIMMVDLANDPEFTDELTAITEQMEKLPRDVVLNFGDVTFLNSSNISLLLKLRKVLLDNKRRLCLCGIAIQVWGVFLLTGLDSIFDVAEDTASALASIQMRE